MPAPLSCNLVPLTVTPDGLHAAVQLAQAAVQAAALAACGQGRPYVADPPSCRFDPAVLACTGVDTAACLTPRQVDLVRQVYRGLPDPGTGRHLPGLMPGAEADPKVAWANIKPDQEQHPPVQPLPDTARIDPAQTEQIEHQRRRDDLKRDQHQNCRLQRLGPAQQPDRQHRGRQHGGCGGDHHWEFRLRRPALRGKYD